MIKTRVHEHRLAVRRGEQYSQIAGHMMDLGHRFDFENVSVLASDRTKGGRLLKEAWLSTEGSINRHIELCPAYLMLRARSRNNPPPHQRDPVGTTNVPVYGLMERTPPPLRLGDTRAAHEQRWRGIRPPPKTMGPSRTLEERRLGRMRESPSEEESDTPASPSRGAIPDERPSKEPARRITPSTGGGRMTRLRATSTSAVIQAATATGAAYIPQRRPWGNPDGAAWILSPRSKERGTKEATNPTCQKRSGQDDPIEIETEINEGAEGSGWHKIGAVRLATENQEGRQKGRGLERAKGKRGKGQPRGVRTVGPAMKNSRSKERSRERGKGKVEKVDDERGGSTRMVSTRMVSARTETGASHPMAPSRQCQPMDYQNVQSAECPHVEERGNRNGGANIGDRDCGGVGANGDAAASGCRENGITRLDAGSWEERQGGRLERTNVERVKGCRGEREEGGVTESRSVRAKDCHYYLRASARQEGGITNRHKESGHDKLTKVRTTVNEEAKGNRSWGTDTRGLTAGGRRKDERGRESERGREKGCFTPPPQRRQPMNHRNDSTLKCGVRSGTRSFVEGGDKGKDEGSIGSGSCEGDGCERDGYVGEGVRNPARKGERGAMASISPKRTSDAARTSKKRTQEIVTGCHTRTGNWPVLPGPMTRSKSRMQVSTEP